VCLFSILAGHVAIVARGLFSYIAGHIAIVARYLLSSYIVAGHVVIVAARSLFSYIIHCGAHGHCGALFIFIQIYIIVQNLRSRGNCCC
jgi:hypothetical protein